MIRTGARGVSARLFKIGRQTRKKRARHARQRKGASKKQARATSKKLWRRERRTSVEPHAAQDTGVVATLRTARISGR